MAFIKTERSERGSHHDRDGGDDRGAKKLGTANFHRKKICKFCSDNDYVLDYKDYKMMQSFITEHGKLIPRRISGCCATHQRKLTVAVKRARNIALVGYVTMGN